MRNMLAIGVLMSLVCPAQAIDELTTKDLQQLQAALAPKDAAWKSIPWHPTLLSAQRQAARQRKLIFIWSMDGHPLGCT